MNDMDFLGNKFMEMLLEIELVKKIEELKIPMKANIYGLKQVYLQFKSKAAKKALEELVVQINETLEQIKDK